MMSAAPDWTTPPPTPISAPSRAGRRLLPPSHARHSPFIWYQAVRADTVRWLDNAHRPCQRRPPPPARPLAPQPSPDLGSRPAVRGCPPCPTLPPVLARHAAASIVLTTAASTAAAVAVDTSGSVLVSTSAMRPPTVHA